MKKPLLTILFLSLSLLSFSQRSITYPIILVHGLNGGSDTWDNFKSYLVQAGLNMEQTDLSYCLNHDGSLYSSNKYNDVSTWGNWTIGDKDVYAINFKTCNYSNESAIVKQGYALKFAIGRVLATTGADKVVLLGHSMGGLAIREYLQNTENWQSDGRHHVAKLITIGTPHGGSDLGSGGLNIASIFKDPFDENGEAVRDLKNSFITSLYYDNGVYLFGGYESRSKMTTNIIGQSKFYNIDVNCNGQTGDYVVGLNDKDIYTDLEFACIIGGPTTTDGVVLSKRQNLNNYYNISAKIYNYYCNGDLNCHRNEPKLALNQMMSSLDEGENKGKYYNIGLNKTYTGFFQVDFNGSTGDVDAYTFDIPRKGKIFFGAYLPNNSTYGQAILIDGNGYEIYRKRGDTFNDYVEAPSAGKYTLILAGSSGSSYQRYTYQVNFCSYLDTPSITSSNATTFCEGNSTTLSVPSGFEAYQWYKDGVKIGSNATQLQVSQVGTYTLDAYKCGNANKTSNSVKITVNPNPVKPDLQIEEKPLLFTLKTGSTESINWLLNGTPISKATTSNYVPQKGGNYSILASKGNCFSQSDVITIPDAPTLSALTNTVFCEGDSLRIKANVNVNTYRWYRDSTKLANVKSELVVKQSGTYRAVLQSGRGLSIPSVAIIAKTKTTPAKPLITNDIKPEQFTLNSNSVVNNQWYFNNVAINSANQQNHVPEQVGNYFVRVTNDGCFSNSETVRIFIDKPIIELTSKNPACDSILLRSPKGFGAYRWNIGGQALNTLNNEIVVKKSSNVSLNVGRGKISSPQSDIVGIVINPTPTKPTITLTEDLEIPSLKSSYLLGNQWYLSGTIIDKATDQFLRNLSYGEYKVSTTQLGCTNISEPYKLALLDDFTFAEKTRVFPNPSSGEFKVEVPFSNITNISIYGINGTEYFSNVIKSFNRGKEMSVSLPSGTYLIKVVADGKEVIKKFIINR
jgi:pimeloyl-ACP methyl ester carboxylesterase